MTDREIPVDTTLVDLLDAALATGVAVQGDAVVAVADVPLLHLGLRLVLRGLEDDRVLDGTPIGGATDAMRPARARDVASVEEGEDASTVSDAGPGHAASLADATTQRLASLVAAGEAGTADPAEVQRGLAALVLTLVDVLREVLERQAIRRMEADTLDDDQVERLGLTFQALRLRLDELRDVFGLDEADLGLDLGPIGRLGA